ncbi:MAG: divalent-cation tolerance protein CutA [Candidatus Heimdallarchaeota archaeon]|nr:MAG: divalent-cation tolerance protein CutA [Candidatus Heimdallarchaeota archaeon]
MMFVAVYTTFGSLSQAKKLARLLLDEKLIACANLIPNVLSIYPWKGEIEEEKEIILWCKTQDFLVEKIQSVIQESHPYDLPALAVYPIHSGSEPYLKWIADETQSLNID